MSGLTIIPMFQPRQEPACGHLLRAERLTVVVGIRTVIDQLDLDIYPGDRFLVQGPNGAGKSTLLNAIAGTAPARVVDGRVTFHGRDVTSLPPHERARLGIGYVRQRDNTFPDLSVAENLAVALGPRGYATFAASFPSWSEALGPNARAGQLSGGERQRLAWAMAVLRPGHLLLADEAEAGLPEAPPVPGGRACLVVSHHTDLWTQKETI